MGLLLTPLFKVNMTEVSALAIPWAADNGAFSGFDPDRFKAFLRRIAGIPNCLWVACPDVVGDARTTLAMFDQWREEIEVVNLPTALVLQDGQENLDLPDADAYFVGGSTKFKLSSAADGLISEARRRGKSVHMGRVNTKRRVRHAHERHIDSIDGTSMRFAGFDSLLRICEYVAILDTYRRLGRGTEAWYSR